MTNTKQKATYSSGQSLFELVVAVGLVSLILVALIGLATKSISNTTFSRNRSLAARYNQESLEWLRGQRDMSWDNFINNNVKNPSGGNESTWCLQSLNFTIRRACNSSENIQNTTFLRKMTLTYIPAAPPSVSVVAVTSWTDSNGVHESNATTVLTNWKVD